MKKIIFVGEYMLCGGVEKSLISLLNSIDHNKYDITLMLLKKEGVLLSQIPDYVNVIEMDLPKDEINDILYGKTNALKIAFKNKKLFSFIKKILRGIYLNIVSKSNEEKRVNYYKLIDHKFKEFPVQYDIAIDYMGYGLLNTFYVAKKIKANKKYTWVHFEPLECMDDFNSFEYYLKYYNKIICVSKNIRSQLNTIMPKFNDKFDVFYNIVDYTRLYKESNLISNVYDNKYTGKKILSIGRLDKQKGFDIGLSSIEMLLNSNYDIKWYIIGEGNQRELLEKIIKEKKLEKNVILLGQQTNPYVYLKNCDYYFQPSRHEGYGIAVAEARAFCKPIVATDFAGAKEQIKNNETGVIVECNAIALYNGLKLLLDDDKICELFKKNLKTELITSTSIMKDIEKLFEG